MNASPPSSATSKAARTTAAMEDTSTKLATFGTEIANIKTTVGQVENRMERFEGESRDNFLRLFDKLEKATAPRPTPWNLILTAMGVLVAILTAIAGGGLTAVLALAAWANAYFGQSIDKIDAKAEQSMAIHSTISSSLSDFRTQMSRLETELINAAKERERMNARLDEISRRAEPHHSAISTQ